MRHLVSIATIVATLLPVGASAQVSFATIADADVAPGHSITETFLSGGYEATFDIYGVLNGVLVEAHRERFRKAVSNHCAKLHRYLGTSNPMCQEYLRF